MSSKQKAILTGSVILNVILIGLYLGHVLHCSLIPDNSHQAVAQLLLQIPEQRRPFIQDHLNIIWHDLEVAHNQINDGKKVALKIMQAEPFNEAQYTVQMQKLEEMHRQMKAHMTEALIALAKQLSPQERSILAQITFYPPPDLPAMPLASSK